MGTVGVDLYGVRMSNPPLQAVEITPDNVEAAMKVKVRKDQNTFVAPVVTSLAEAYASRETVWTRLILDGDRPVAFVMADFAPDEDEPDFQCGIWRLNVAEGEQGKGYGSFAVRAFLEEARGRGNKRVTVMWVPGEGGPAEFYRKLGFHDTGRVFDGEVVAELFLD
ncbi:putative acetyltransferase [Nocardiopsis sp. JB363]|nr:putative acetyltransferase [Nocardiopsis sp. JB363]